MKQGYVAEGAKTYVLAVLVGIVDLFEANPPEQTMS
jgi:hypothetical protein